MIIDATFFRTFVTLVALAWSGYELFRVKEDPLGRRLEELQAYAMATKSNAESRRRGGGGFLNTFLYYVSIFPGGDSWLQDTEKELGKRACGAGRGSRITRCSR